MMGAEGMGGFEDLGEGKGGVCGAVDFQVRRAAAGYDLGRGCGQGEDVGCVGCGTSVIMGSPSRYDEVAYHHLSCVERGIVSTIQG